MTKKKELKENRKLQFKNKFEIKLEIKKTKKNPSKKNLKMTILLYFFTQRNLYIFLDS